MDNQLTTEVITHFILKHNGPKQPITQEEYNQLIKYYGTDRKGMPLKNNKIIIFSNIADIPEVEAYYQENPEKRPDQKIQSFSTLALPAGQKKWTPELSIKRYENLKKSLTENSKRTNSGKISQGVQGMIDHCDVKINQIKKC